MLRSAALAGMTFAAVVAPGGRFGCPGPYRGVPGLAQVSVGGRRADGADVAVGAARVDQVNQGPLLGQGTHGAAPRGAVDVGEVQPVGAGRADGTAGAAERKPRVSADGFVSGVAPGQATAHRLWHPQKLVSLTISNALTLEAQTSSNS